MSRIGAKALCECRDHFPHSHKEDQPGGKQRLVIEQQHVGCRRDQQHYPEQTILSATIRTDRTGDVQDFTRFKIQ